MSRPDPRPALVYIASTGRAGSTLLELLLNAHPRIVGLGELHHWPQLGNGAPCGCGVPVRQCSFWGRVRELADPESQRVPRIDYFARAHSTGRAAHEALERRLPEWLAQLRSSPGTGATRRMIQRYADNNMAVLRACTTAWYSATGRAPDWWVDASKDPFRLGWLLESGRFRIKVVHLFRDPRAYTYSAAIRHRPRPHEYGRLRAMLTHALIWRFKNALIREVVSQKMDSADYCQVSYEALCRDPEGELRRICAMLGCEFASTMTVGFRNAVSHSVAGNYMRFDRRPIRLDEDWRRRFPWHERWLVSRAAALPPSLIESLVRLRQAQRDACGSPRSTAS